MNDKGSDDITNTSLPMSVPTPQPGFVHLVLRDIFYLEIPIQIVSSLCLKPLKYLRYVGWSVMGVMGELKDHQGNPVDLDGTLPDQSVYEYKTLGPIDRACVVRPDHIKKRSSTAFSEYTPRRANFRQEVLDRDGRCVWTGVGLGNAMHILPHRLGDNVCFLSLLLVCGLIYTAEAPFHYQQAGTPRRPQFIA